MQFVAGWCEEISACGRGGAAGAAERLEVLVEHAGEVGGEADALCFGVGAEGALELDVGLLAGDVFGAGGGGEVGGGEADGALGGGLLLDDDVEGAVGCGGGVDDEDAGEGADGVEDLAGDGAGGVIAGDGNQDVDLADGGGSAGWADEPMLFGVGLGGGHEARELGLRELVEAVGFEVVGRDAEGLLDVGRPDCHGCFGGGSGLVRGGCGGGLRWCGRGCERDRYDQDTRDAANQILH